VMCAKDYIAIAGVIKETRESADDKEYSVDLFQSTLVSRLAKHFASENGRFNNEKFRQACYGKGEDDGKKVE